MSYASGLMMGTAIIRILGQILSSGGSGGMGGMSSRMGGSIGGMGGRMGGRSGGSADFGSLIDSGFNMLGSGMKGGRGSGRSRTMESQEMPSMNFVQQQNTMAAEKLVLVSSLPGRRRYRMSGMSEEQAALLQDTLGKLSYVKKAEANIVTGSLLLLYDETRTSDLDTLMEKVSAVFGGARGGNGGESHPMKYAMALESHVGLLTRTVRSVMRDVSRWLLDRTGGWLDASSLSSLIFFFQGFKKMMMTQQFPSGSQMLWWAISLMRGWRTL